MYKGKHGFSLYREWREIGLCKEQLIKGNTYNKIYIQLSTTLTLRNHNYYGWYIDLDYGIAWSYHFSTILFLSTTFGPDSWDHMTLGAQLVESDDCILQSNKPSFFIEKTVLISTHLEKSLNLLPRPFQLFCSSTLLNIAFILWLNCVILFWVLHSISLCDCFCFFFFLTGFCLFPLFVLSNWCAVLSVKYYSLT